MQLRIKVLQEHIDKGRKGRADFCPITLAIKDTLPDTDDVAVFGGSARLNGRMVTLDKHCSEFVEHFDRFGNDYCPEVAPFSFTFEV